VLAGLAHLFEGEKRRPRHEVVVAQRGEEGDVSFVEDEAGFPMASSVVLRKLKARIAAGERSRL